MGPNGEREGITANERVHLIHPSWKLSTNLHLEVTFTSKFDVETSFKDFELVHMRSFEMNWQQIYSFIHHESPQLIHISEVTFTSQFDAGMSFKDFQWVHMTSFAMNWQQIYRR